MPGFAITPAGGFNPPVGDEFPRGIQFQWNGVNLGGPDVTVVNFVGAGFSVVRGGSGVDEDTITVALE